MYCQLDIGCSEAEPAVSKLNQAESGLRFTSAILQIYMGQEVQSSID